MSLLCRLNYFVDDVLSLHHSCLATVISIGRSKERPQVAYPCRLDGLRAPWLENNFFYLICLLVANYTGYSLNLHLLRRAMSAEPVGYPRKCLIDYITVCIGNVIERGLIDWTTNSSGAQPPNHPILHAYLKRTRLDPDEAINRYISLVMRARDAAPGTDGTRFRLFFAGFSQRCFLHFKGHFSCEAPHQ